MKSDYYVVTFETNASQSWHWEIRRRSNPMGVRFTEGGYPTQIATENAGERELAKFLYLLAKEASRPRNVGQIAPLRKGSCPTGRD